MWTPTVLDARAKICAENREITTATRFTLGTEPANDGRRDRGSELRKMLIIPSQTVMVYVVSNTLVR